MCVFRRHPLKCTDWFSVISCFAVQLHDSHKKKNENLWHAHLLGSKCHVTQGDYFQEGMHSLAGTLSWSVCVFFFPFPAWLGPAVAVAIIILLHAELGWGFNSFFAFFPPSSFSKKNRCNPLERKGGGRRAQGKRITQIKNYGLSLQYKILAVYLELGLSSNKSLHLLLLNLLSYLPL